MDVDAARGRLGMSASREGLVIEGTGGQWRVLTDTGEVVTASMRGRLKQGRADDGGKLKLAVGDHVSVESTEVMGQVTWAIHAIGPRGGVLARREPGGRHGERIVASNVDQVVCVFAAANPEPHERMLDRFLIIAEANELRARVIINKVELVDEAATAARFSAYADAGYPVHLVSVKARRGLDAVHAAFAGQVSVVTGPSGVGKSSLMNAIYPGLTLRVGEVSESVHKGRHTTVGAFLHPIPEGGSIIDTPGLREVGMWGLPAEHLDACFPEFRAVLGSCRFQDCAHTVEPGCAVRAAIGAGVSRSRYESYAQLHGELVTDAAERPTGRR